MDLNNISNFIGQCGFPVFVSIICIVAFYKIGKTLFEIWQTDVKPTLDALKDTQIEFIKTLQSNAFNFYLEVIKHNSVDNV